MSKYLIKANYNSDGAAGLAAKGGTARRDAVGKMVADAGGSDRLLLLRLGRRGRLPGRGHAQRRGDGSASP